MRSETLEYKDGDVTLKGYLALDDQSDHQRPGILVMPEAFGLGEHAKERALRLASLGYVALAGDPYGDGLEVADLQEAVKHAGAIRETAQKFRQRGRAALDTLAALPQVDADRLAMIGFCMGGSFSLELARDGGAAVRYCVFSRCARNRHTRPGRTGQSQDPGLSRRR